MTLKYAQCSNICLRFNDSIKPPITNRTEQIGSIYYLIVGLDS